MTPSRPVLVVEDDPALRRLLAGALLRDGHAVLAFEGGLACARWLRESADTRSAPPSLILCDVRMAQGGGLELLAAVRRALPAVPVLLMTAFGDADVHRRARLAGAADVLDKPVDVDLLRARVRGLVGAGA